MSGRLYIAIGMICSLLVLTSGFSAGSAWAEGAFYSVHVGSFKKAENAARQVADFQNRGYYAIGRREHVDGKGEWHRVYVGQYADYSEARRLGASLVQQGVIHSFTVRPVDLTVTTASSVPLPYTPEMARQQTYNQNPAPAPQPWTQPTPAAPPQNQPPLPYGPVRVLQPVPGPYQQQPVTMEGCVAEDPPMVMTAEKGRVIRPANPGPGPKASGIFQFDPRFKLGARTGFTQWNHPGDFVIIRNTGTVNIAYNQTNATGYHLAVVPSLVLNKYFTVESSLERAWTADWALWSLCIDPKVTMPITDNIAGYFKMGLVWGTFAWDDVPGDFDNNFGWEMGSGLTWDFGPYMAGLDLTYRDIQFKYNSPGSNVWSSKDDIDMTSVSIGGSFEYKF